MVAVLEQQEELVSVERAIPMRRVWAMPNKNTFDIPPIRALVKSYLAKSKVSIDPFARNKRWATYTNDLNPDTAADNHLDVLEFLRLLETQNVKVDLVLFDPPYSARQIKECYEGIGLAMPYERTLGWGNERATIDRILSVNGAVVSCGWSSVGMGSQRGYSIEEILLVSHGKVHNDTIVMVERKLQSDQTNLFSVEPSGLSHSKRIQRPRRIAIRRPA